MQSPLSSLCEVLKLVKSSALSYREKLLVSEAVTRAVLIDPVLRALGWDIANPANVEVEKPFTAGRLSSRIDYLLNTDNAEKPIVIEAKRLGEPLEPYFSQIVQYACTLRIENLFLTDGLKWFHFTNISASNNTSPSCIDIGAAEGQDLTKIAAFFVERLDAALFTPDQQNDIEALKEKIFKLTQRIEDMHSMINRITAVSMQTESLFATNGVTDNLPWLLLESSWDAKKKKPAKFRLPDGSILDIRSWTQVLVEACKHCLSEKPQLLAQLPIPDRTDRATKLISTIRPPSNLNSDMIAIGDTTLYVCTNYSANDCVANAGYILGKLGSGLAKPAILLAG